MRRLLWAGFWSVALSGAALYLFARDVMNPAVAAIVCWHIFGGVALAVPAIVVVRKTQRPQGFFRKPLFPILGIICLLTGFCLVSFATVGASMRQADIVFGLHVITGLTLLAASALLAVRRWMVVRHAASIAAAGITVSGGVLGLCAYTYGGESYYRTLTATTAGQTGNPLYPACARIQEGAWRDAQSPDECASCHPNAHGQWSLSRHAGSAENPRYREAFAGAVRTLGADGARWCQGCHSPLALLTEQGTGDTEQDSGSISCLSCHAMSSVPGPIGNGVAVYAPPAAYPFARSRQGVGRKLHDFLIRVRPQPHRATLAGPPDRNEMCAPCHQLSVTAAQNHYRYLPYDDTWRSWRAGADSGDSLHVFRPAAVSRDCVDCHLRAGGGAIDHSGRVDPAMRKRAFRVEIFALRRPAIRSGGLDRIDWPLSHRPVMLNAGQQASIDVLVENTGAGHLFPTGMPDARQVWLSLTVSDADGRRLYDSDNHRYGLVALDRGGRLIAPGGMYDMVSSLGRRVAGAGQDDVPLYRSFAPGQGDVARYRLVVPRGTKGALRINATLLNRASGDSVTPSTVLAQHSITIRVREGEVGSSIVAAALRDDPGDAPRFLAFGAALLLQKDVRYARRAFLQARSLSPDQAEYSVALARTYLEEGDLLAAKAALEDALRFQPGSKRAGVWLGRTSRLMGQYERSLDILQPIAREYARDSQSWFDIGLSLFNLGRYEEAADAFTRILDVDPDDTAAHFNLMQCWRRLRRLSDARREEAIYVTLQDSEPPADITEKYLRAHPGAALESEPAHEHVLGPGPGVRAQDRLRR